MSEPSWDHLDDVFPPSAEEQRIIFDRLPESKREIASTIIRVSKLHGLTVRLSRDADRYAQVTDEGEVVFQSDLCISYLGT